MGVFARVHSFLEKYQSTPNSRLDLFYKDHTTVMRFEDEYEETPKLEEFMVTDGRSVRGIEYAPQAFRREIAIETREYRWGRQPDTADISIHDFHGSGRPIECYYNIEAHNGGVIHATMGHTIPRRLSRDDNLAWYRTQERNMAPYDFRQLHMALGEISLARARIIRAIEMSEAR